MSGVQYNIMQFVRLTKCNAIRFSKIKYLYSVIQWKARSRNKNKNGLIKQTNKGKQCSKNRNIEYVKKCKII